MLTVPSEAEFKILVMAIDGSYEDTILRGKSGEMVGVCPGATLVQLKAMAKRGFVKLLTEYGRPYVAYGAQVTDFGRRMVALDLADRIAESKDRAKLNRALMSA